MNIASGALLSMNGHTLNNTIEVVSGATLDMGGSSYASLVNWHEGGILLNTENNKGTLNIMTRTELELGAKSWAGSVVTDTDTVFTLTTNQNLGALGAAVNCWIGGRGNNNTLQSISFTGGHDINIDNYGAKWAVILSENVTFQDTGDLTFSNNAADMTDTDALYGAGAIAANDTVTFSGTGALTFSGNSVRGDSAASRRGHLRFRRSSVHQYGRHQLCGQYRHGARRRHPCGRHHGQPGIFQHCGRHFLLRQYGGRKRRRHQQRF